MTFQQRRSRLLELLTNDNQESILIVEPTDIRWLTGFNSSNAAAILDQEKLILATDNRYAAQARAVAKVADIELDLVVSGKAQAAAIARYQELVPHTIAESADVDPRPNPAVLAQARAVKDPDEISALRVACEISVAALTRLLPKITVGQTEVHVARMLELEMALLGADDRAFPTIAAAGTHSAIPHHLATTRELQPGDLLKLDFGACYQGYNADCTRTFVVGAAPANWQLELHSQVLEASEIAKRVVVPDCHGGEIDAAAREFFTHLGMQGLFLHGLGHGVGLDVHEYPFLTPNSSELITNNSVFTIEPGLYVEGKGGVRIEDTCVLLADELETLTQFDRDLLKLG